MNNKSLIAVLVCAALSGCGTTGNSDSSSASSSITAENKVTTRAQIDSIVERHTRDFMQQQPALATSLSLNAQVGGSDFNARLPDYSPTGMRKLQNTMNSAVQELNKIDLNGLSDKDRLHISVNKVINEYFAGDMDFPAGYIDTWGGHLPYIVSQISGPLIDVPTVLQDQHTIKSRVDADNYIKRLKAFSVMIDQVLEKVKFDEKAGIILPKKLFPNTLRYLDGFVSPAAAKHALVTSLVERLKGASGIDGKMQQMYVDKATKLVANEIYPRYKTVRAYMAELENRAPDADGIWAVPGGSDFYQHEILYLGDSTMSADEIHQIGLDEVARITKEMDVILKANGMSEGTVGDRLIAMNNNPRFVYEDSDNGREELLQFLRDENEKIKAKAPMLFNVMPKQDVVVKRVPIVREVGAPGGYYQPPALDGSRPGEFYINLYDIKSQPSYTLKTLTYHEAVPGHHFQIALNMEQTDIGIMRQNGQFNGYVEGWALYSELLAKEIDMYEGDPWGDLGRLQAELYRAARLVVDTGLHHKRWSRAKTVDYFYKATGTSRHDAEGAINRYMAWPGQALGYKLGMLKIVELREWAKKQLGDKFDIKAFHDLVLLPGSRPLTILDADVKRWVNGH